MNQALPILGDDSPYRGLIIPIETGLQSAMMLQPGIHLGKRGQASMEVEFFARIWKHFGL